MPCITTPRRINRVISALAAALLLTACSDHVRERPLTPAQHEIAMAAKIAFDRGDYTEAARIYRGLLAEVPGNHYVISNLGVAQFRAGELPLAEETFKKAIAIAPADGFSHCTLGIVYYSEGRYDDALHSLKRAAELDPGDATPHRYLAVIYSHKGLQVEAAKERKEARKLDPNSDKDTLPEPPRESKTIEA